MTLFIQVATGGSPYPGDPESGVMFDENLNQDRLIGTITGGQTGWIYKFNFSDGFYGDAGGRFYIVGNQIFVKAATDSSGNSLFDYEVQALHQMSIQAFATEGGPDLDEGQFGVYLRDVNEAPTILSFTPTGGASTASVTENLPAGQVIGTFIDFDEDRDLGEGDGDGIFTYTITTNPGGFFQVTRVGEEIRLVTTGPLDYEAADLIVEVVGGVTRKYYEIVVSVTDDGGANGGTPLSTSQTFRVYVGDVTEGPTNRPPPVPSGSGTINEGTAANTTVVTLAAQDADGQTITYTFQNALAGSNGLISANGRFKIVGNQIQVNNPAVVSGNETADYTIVANDGSGQPNATATGNVTITINNVNQAPPAPSGSGTINEGTAANTTVVTLPAQDNDGQTITYTFQNALAGSNGLVSADGRFKIVGNVIQVNNPAVVSTNETANYSVVANDGSGQPNATATGNVTITINNVNQAPPAPSGSGTINEGTAANTTVVTLAAQDADGQTITYTFQNALAGSNGLISGDGRFKIVNNTIQVNNPSTVSSTETFTYSIVANDGSGTGTATSTGGVSITINDVPPGNRPPTNPSGSISISEGSAPNVLVVALDDRDDDGQIITYTFQNAQVGSNGLVSADGRFRISGNTIVVNNTFTVTTNESTSYAIVANDGQGAANSVVTGNMVITITNVNQRPPAPSGTGTINEGTGANTLVVTLASQDADQQVIRYTFQNALAGSNGLISADGLFKIVNNTIVVNNPATVTTNQIITYSIVADDGSGEPNATASGGVTITINNVNQAPPAPSGSGTINEGTAANTTVVTLAAQDADGQTINYTFQNALAGSNGLISADGRFKIVGNQIQVNNPAVVSGNETADYSIVANDGSGQPNAIATGNVTITVNNVNQAPPAPSANVVINEGTAANTTVVTLPAQDGDGQTISYSFQTALAGSNGLISGDGRFKIVGNQIQVNTATTVTQDEVATYNVVANDGSGGNNATAIGGVTITLKNVPPVNTPPTIPAGTAAINEGTAANTNVLVLDDRDDDGQIIGYTFTNAQVNSGGLISADGRFKIVGNTIVVNNPTTVNADETFTYSVVANDGSGTSNATSTGNVSITIRNVAAGNQPPANLTFQGSPIGELINSGKSIGTLSASDANGDILSYKIVTSTGVLADSDGRFKVVGNQLLVDNGVLLDFEQARQHSVTIEVSDSRGGTARQTFVVNVSDLAQEVMTVAHESALNDVIKASKTANSKDTLRGGLGDDKLWGGYGNDTLWGGTGRDIFVFDGKLGTASTDKKVNYDTIKDYSVKDDSIWLDNDLFKSNKKLYAAIKKGVETKPMKMASKFFTVGDKAKDADDYFVYDARKRVLYYDADGNGAKAATEMATFANNKALKGFGYKEFFFI